MRGSTSHSVKHRKEKNRKQMPTPVNPNPSALHSFDIWLPETSPIINEFMRCMSSDAGGLGAPQEYERVQPYSDHRRSHPLLELELTLNTHYIAE